MFYDKICYDNIICYDYICKHNQVVNSCIDQYLTQLI